MGIFLITLAVLLIVVLAMSVGVIFADKPIKGSCGGMSAIGIDTECDICGGNTAKCEEEQERVQAESKKSLFYSAAKAPDDSGAK